MSNHLGTKLDQMLNEIDQILPEIKRPIAAFDADGTLWRTDMGEAFFDYQIKHRLVDLPSDPLAHYHDLKENHSKAEAYLWLAQINQGWPLTQVRQWAEACLQDLQPLSTFESQKKLIDHLHKKNVEVYVVTASAKWAVEPAALLYNIPFENVIGIETEVTEGLVTDKQKGPITYRDGKVQGLLKRSQGDSPFFCAGNTEGDLPLLEAATHLRLVMASAKPGEENHAVEQEMVQLAQEQGWFFQMHM